MFNLLNQPYPSSEKSPGHRLRTAALIGLFVGLFLVTFQPFGLSIWQTPHKALKIAGFGLITFVVTAFYFAILPRLFPNQFADKHWTVGREIILITGNILLIAIGNWLYLNWLTDGGQNGGLGWLGMILGTFLIGVFPVTGVVLFNYIRQLKKYSQGAAGLPVHLLPPTGTLGASSSPGPATDPSDATLTLIAENEKDTLTVESTNLLFIESSDNYCTVVYFRNGQPVKPLLRSSLSRLEGQINAPHIVRCHRSYVVNLDRIERVTGNAQGYKLHLLGGQFQVPVARKYNDSLVNQLKAL